MLAFQKLLMRDTRLPDQLFQQAAFAPGGYPQADYFMHPSMTGQMGPPMGPPMGQFGGSPYSPYAGLPMPPPIRTDGRRGSSASVNRMSLPQLDFEPPSFPAPLSKQTTGESGYGGGKRGSAGGLNSPLENGRDEGMPRPANGKSPNMPRSQTVYWDDADFSSGGDGRGRRGPGHSNGPSPNPGRGGSSNPPPSSLRHSQVLPNSTGMSANSRSVSFHEERRPATVHSAGSSSGSFANSRSNSGTAIGPSGLSNLQNNSGQSSGSGSASSGPSDASLPKQPEGDNGKVRKSKSSHSVKHLSTAFQKFWVD